ncbi:hypothetical protein Hypma_006164 [Hypsizygus marmoreus]|uniref:Uncharacterized protein n=1 Tax=Hypsizygus marmoreus TaxID=39966 RepID=A0A369JV20_HYPMA|nr:hypothetical protein Hypma_006164 [Hypsizygus marmoreus]
MRVDGSHRQDARSFFNTSNMPSHWLGIVIETLISCQVMYALASALQLQIDVDCELTPDGELKSVLAWCFGVQWATTNHAVMAKSDS